MRFIVICFATFFFACHAQQNSNETCQAIASDFQASSAGIASIIQAGTVKLCQPVEFTAETAPEDFRYVERILFYFNQNYNTNVTATIVQKNSSNDCFDALKNGSVDVVGPNFSFGVFVGDIPRSDLFAVSCPNFVNLVGIAVSDNVTTVDWANFLATYGLNANKTNNNTATQPVKIGTSGFGDYLTALGLFPDQDVIMVSDAEFLDIFDMGQVDVLWDVGTDDFGPNGLGLTRNARFILTDVPVTVGAFFKYNNC